MNNATQATIEAAAQIAWEMMDDSFIILGVETNHQDPEAWDVIVKMKDGEVLRATTWLEAGNWYCEW